MKLLERILGSGSKKKRQTYEMSEIDDCPTSVSSKQSRFQHGDRRLEAIYGAHSQRQRFLA